MRRPMSSRLAALAFLTLASGCGLSTQVRPTPKDTVAVQAAVGGPAALVGAPVPLPLAAAGVAWGFHERADLSAHTHLTTLAAARLFGLDVGLSWLALAPREKAPALTVGLRGYAFTDFASGTLGFYEASLAASWDVGRWRPFAALAVQLDTQALLWDVAPAVGTELAFGRFVLVAELKWFAPNRDARFSSLKWLAPFGRGALGLVIGGRYDVPLGPRPAGEAR